MDQANLAFKERLAEYRQLWTSYGLPGEMFQRFANDVSLENGEFIQREVRSLLENRHDAKVAGAFRLGWLFVGHARAIYHTFVTGTFKGQSLRELAQPIHELLITVGLEEALSKWDRIVGSIESGSFKKESLWDDLMDCSTTIAATI
jgi:hypothetical protein